MTASSLTPIQPTVNSSVNTAKTDGCVVSTGGSGDTGAHPPTPRPGASETPSLPPPTPHRDWLWLSRPQKPRGRRKWVGGSWCGTGSCPGTTRLHPVLSWVLDIIKRNNVGLLFSLIQLSWEFILENLQNIDKQKEGQLNIPYLVYRLPVCVYVCVYACIYI